MKGNNRRLASRCYGATEGELCPPAATAFRCFFAPCRREIPGRRVFHILFHGRYRHEVHNEKQHRHPDLQHRLRPEDLVSLRSTLRLRRGDRGLCRLPADPSPAPAAGSGPDLGRRGPGLYQAGPELHHPLRRRGPAGQTGHGAEPKGDGAYDLRGV